MLHARWIAEIKGLKDGQAQFENLKWKELLFRDKMTQSAIRCLI
jgi:hypothetical protein